MKNTITFLLTATSLLATQSAFSQYFVDDPTFGTDQIYVDATGLGWLNLNNSNNLSINDVSSQFGVGGDFEGFRYATETEFFGLVEHLIGLAIPGWDPTTAITTSFDDMNTMLGAVGTTINDFPQSINGNPDALTDYSIGLFENGTFAFFIATDYTDSSLTDEGILLRFAGLGTSSIGQDDTLEGAGHFLVSTETFSPVPEPATIGLLAFGALGALLVIRRRVVSRKARQAT